MCTKFSSLKLQKINYFREMDGGQEDDVTADSKETVGVHSNGATRINLT